MGRDDFLVMNWQKLVPGFYTYWVEDDIPTSAHTRPALPATLRRGTFYIPMRVGQVYDWLLDPFRACQRLGKMKCKLFSGLGIAGVWAWHPWHLDLRSGGTLWADLAGCDDEKKETKKQRPPPLGGSSILGLH